MQQFILASLITEIKKGKSVKLSQIPAEIVTLLYEEAAKSSELKMALEGLLNKHQ